MWIRFVNIFTKITGWPLQLVLFRTKIHYEDKSLQGRKIKGPAIIVSNHTSIFDYAVYMFVFIGRTLRCLMAEVLFEKPFLRGLLRSLGGIRVDRNAMDMGFLADAEDILSTGGIVEIFPEGRLPLPGEERPLEFRSSAAYLALATGAKIIPVYTDGSYFAKKRAHVIIGLPFDSGLVENRGLTQPEQISELTGICRQRIIGLEKLLDEQKKTV